MSSKIYRVKFDDGTVKLGAARDPIHAICMAVKTLNIEHRFYDGDLVPDADVKKVSSRNVTTVERLGDRQHQQQVQAAVDEPEIGEEMNDDELDEEFFS